MNKQRDKSPGSDLGLIRYSRGTKMEFVRFMLDRLKEPSTYGGLGLLATSIGIVLSPQQLEATIVVCMGVAGLAATLLPEKK